MIEFDTSIKLNDYLNHSKIVLIIDINVFNLYKSKIDKIKRTNYYIVESGDNNKSIDIKNKIENYLFKNNFNRNSCIVAIGGGVVGDLSGFIASTYMRGIDFYQIPTTLLAMVDSSIGGKTGINNLFGKNLIGSFYKPKKIIIDINFLKTLPKEEIINGFAEIIKMGIVVGGKLWDILESNNLDIINNTDKLLEIIKLSALSKFNITENDFKETNNRMILWLI